MRKIYVLVFGTSVQDWPPFENDRIHLVFGKALPLDTVIASDAVWAFIDWVLPDISGLEMCRRLRCDPLTAAAHITMIVDGDDPDGRQRALRAGADDYIVGPVDRDSVCRRILASPALKDNNASLGTLRFGELVIEAAAHQVRWQAKPIPLMPNEFRLLRFFIEHPGRVFTRAQIIGAMGKDEQPVDERTVDVWIGRLRRALKSAGAGDMLRTVRSLGYVLDNPQT